MGTRILGLRLPGWRWLLLALGFVVAAGVATPLLAQSATVDTWSIGGTVRGIDVDATDQVWANVDGSLKKLNPATNLLTSYTHPGGGGSFITVDSAGDVWLPGSLPTVPSATYVLTRMDTSTLQVTSWPLGDSTFTHDTAVDASGKAWTTRATTTLKRIDPATDTLTTWTMPISVAVGGTDSLGKVGLVWSDGTDSGPAVFDPATNSLAYWVAATSPDSAFISAPSVDGAGRVWFIISHDASEDGIGRLDPATNQITEWVCPPGCDRLRSVSVDALGDVWFTEDGSNASGNQFNRTSYIGRLDPAADPPAWTRWAVLCDDVNGTLCGFGVKTTNPRSVRPDSTGKAWAYFAGHGFLSALEVKDDIARLAPPP